MPSLKRVLNRWSQSSADLEKLQPADFFTFPENCQIKNLSQIYEIVFGTRAGTLLEIGAFDGLSYSNSSGLIERGWTAVLIEPIPNFFAKCQSRYIENPRVKVLNVGISNETGVLDFHIAGPLTTGNHKTLEEFSKLDWARNSITSETVAVECTTLRQLINQVSIVELDLLIVDCEGMEPEVLFEFAQLPVKPKVLICEIQDFHPDLNSRRSDYQKLSAEILRSGYSIIYKDFINTIYLKDKLL